ncbi:E3 ubiquitin/ISG15 ligase TRIM25 isoform X2 [Polypterus senegalus]|uniref:E3 ubiquitin/ISG15 ligase TRIM25 isoform X2 n=1 Tax=Polypterus senegalus TaxID=55291 RepID=UPI001964DD81|nr:E3 ubiquitin/ISG15 ligase TRIM25 isoform X2 [Polypterus senegalus]
MAGQRDKLASFSDEQMPSMSLMSLSDELTCSICLSIFDNPVTTPCGHNFCLSCLEMTWVATQLVELGFDCPQCRQHYQTKPDLKKNTVLCSVVETFYKSTKGHSASTTPSSMAPRVDPVSTPKPVLCDTCMVQRAAKTCLTCMASYCESHIVPHRESPAFLGHQLTEPLTDLKDRICQQHYKNMEFFCKDHCCCICSHCLPSHKTCNFETMEMARAEKEREFRNIIVLLNAHSEKFSSVISEMNSLEKSIKDCADKKKSAIKAEFRSIKDILEKEENIALHVVDKEEIGAHNRLRSLMQKMSNSYESLNNYKAVVENVLQQTENISFLQTKADLPEAMKISPYAPKINIDSKPLLMQMSTAAALRNFLSQLMSQPLEKRGQLLTSAFKEPPALNVSEPSGNLPGPILSFPPQPLVSPGKTHPDAHKKPAQTKQKQRKNPDQKPAEPKEAKKSASAKKQPPKEPVCAPSSELPKGCPPTTRHELLQYSSTLTLDFKTAHRRISLSENCTTASISDDQLAYPESPARFSVCSQILCTKGFSQGRHYWEVKLSCSNFCAIGIAYNSIDRKGASSKLGRNKESWCVEWFNVRVSAWHNNQEVVLPSISPSRVGVFLDCEESSVTFYNIADRATPIHKFNCQFQESIYPAFWLFSNGSKITLCKLAA